MSIAYDEYRLWLEYFWIFLAMGITIILHLLIFWSLFRNNQSSRHLPRKCCSSQSSSAASQLTSLQSHHHRRGGDGLSRSNSTWSDPLRPSGHHPAFLIYPLIYIVCATPLAVGRAMDMAGAGDTIGLKYYGFAGALVASHGLLNVILWSTTVVFIGSRDARDTGLDKFKFMRTPHEREYGNMVWVQGGGGGDGGRRNSRWIRDDSDFYRGGGVEEDGMGYSGGGRWWRWWGWGMNRRRGRRDKFSSRRYNSSFSMGGVAGAVGSGYPRPSNISQESLQRSARMGHTADSSGGGGGGLGGGNSGGIQMEVVTTIVVEDEPFGTNSLRNNSNRRRDHSRAPTARSLMSIDKGVDGCCDREHHTWRNL